MARLQTVVGHGPLTKPKSVVSVSLLMGLALLSSSILPLSKRLAQRNLEKNNFFRRKQKSTWQPYSVVLVYMPKKLCLINHFQLTLIQFCLVQTLQKFGTHNNFSSFTWLICFNCTQCTCTRYINHLHVQRTLELLCTIFTEGSLAERFTMSITDLETSGPVVQARVFGA